MPCPHFGNYPEEYNRAVHGPYHPGRYYGKPDTPLGEVKMGELGSWLKRRDYHPKAMYACVSRAVWRWNERFRNPRYATIHHLGQKVAIIVILSYIALYKTLRHHKYYKHHW